MRVSRVDISVYNRNCYTRKNNQPALFQPQLPVRHYGFDRFCKSPTFSAISTHGEFRQLTKDHIIHCLYCRKPMIYGGILKEMLASGFFSEPVGKIVPVLDKYKMSLKKGQRNVFSQIERYSRRSPQTHLSEIITDLYKKSIKSLVKTQAGIFKELIFASEDLSPELRKSFHAFMKVQHKRLYESPHLERFKPEVFAYKISKTCQTISNENLKNYLLRITEVLNDPVFKDSSNMLPDSFKSLLSASESKNILTAEDYVRVILPKIRKISERIGRQDLNRLCETSENMLNNIPVVIPFSNKEFMRTLVLSELKDIKGTPVYYKLVNIARRLPNSQSNMNSFIVKHRYSDSDTIGYKLLEPSLTTLEHINPRSEGGIDDLSNCALACKADNNERQSTPMFEYLRKWSRKTPQVYFNDIIKIANEEQLISPSDIAGMAKSVKTQGKINIDTSKLKTDE